MGIFGSTTPFAEPLWYSRQGNKNYTRSHYRLREAIRQYVDSNIEPFCGEWENAGHVPKEILKRHAELGYTAVLINPAAVRQYLGDIELPGGLSPDEWDNFHEIIATDEIARCGSLGIIWALGCGNAIGCPPLVYFGSAEQKQRFLPAVLRGDSRFCLGMTEAQAGSDFGNIETTGRIDGDHIVVNGKKQWITNVMFADYCTTVVRTGSEGKNGISILIVPLNSKGVSMRKIESSGVNAGGCGSLVFDNVRVPMTNLIGEMDKGYKMMVMSLNHERLWIAGNSLRLARVCVEDAYQHALARRTFGQLLIDRQAIRSKFVSVGMQITGAYAFLESLAEIREGMAGKGQHSGEIEQFARIGGLCALTKVMSARAVELAVRECQQIMGALGYTRSGRGVRVERISRDMRVLVIGGGSEEVMTDLSLLQEGKDMLYLSHLE